MNPEPNETVPGQHRRQRVIVLDGPTATFQWLQYVTQAFGWMSLGLSAALWRSAQLEAALGLLMGVVLIAYGLQNARFVKPLVTYSDLKARAYREARRMHPTYERRELLAVASALIENPELAPYYGGLTMEQLEAKQRGDASR